jgi:hypothetical protein
LTIPQFDAADTRRIASHRTHLVFVEANGLAAARDQNDFTLAICERHADQPIVVSQIHSDDSGGARP